MKKFILTTSLFISLSALCACEGSTIENGANNLINAAVVEQTEDLNDNVEDMNESKISDSDADVSDTDDKDADDKDDKNTSGDKTDSKEESLTEGNSDSDDAQKSDSKKKSSKKNKKKSNTEANESVDVMESTQVSIQSTDDAALTPVTAEVSEQPQQAQPQQTQPQQSAPQQQTQPQPNVYDMLQQYYMPENIDLSSLGASPSNPASGDLVSYSLPANPTVNNTGSPEGKSSDVSYSLTDTNTNSDSDNTIIALFE